VIPKFNYRNKFNVNESLEKLGLTSMFHNFDFGEMTDDKIYVDKVFHEVVVIVDEDGTEATATTTVLMSRGMDFIRSDGVTFIANHPFTYYIRYKPMDIILFIGNFI
jgi:serine protease inhibitor